MAKQHHRSAAGGSPCPGKRMQEESHLSLGGGWKTARLCVLKLKAAEKVRSRAEVMHVALLGKSEERRDSWPEETAV